MSISYEEAMSTLETMFPSADRSVITMVLENNRGHMERTVEQLLVMLPDSGVQQSQPPSQQQQPRAHQQLAPHQERRVAGALIPDDFLRPPSYFAKQSKNQSQEEQDHLLAQMLQDEMFMRELRRNPELFGLEPAAPRGRQRQHPQQRQAAQQQAAPAVASAAGAAAVERQVSADSDAPFVRGSSGISAGSEPDSPKLSFREKFSRLGDAAKRKLQSIVGRFQHREKISDQDNSYMSLPALDDMDGAMGYSNSVDAEEIELQDRRFEIGSNDGDDEGDEEDNDEDDAGDDEDDDGDNDDAPLVIGDSSK